MKRFHACCPSHATQPCRKPDFPFARSVLWRMFRIALQDSWFAFHSSRIVKKLHSELQTGNGKRMMAGSYTYVLSAYKFLEVNQQIMKRQTTPREQKTRAHFADSSFWSKLHYYHFKTPTFSLTLINTYLVLVFRGKGKLRCHTGVFLQLENSSTYGILSSRELARP